MISSLARPARIAAAAVLALGVGYLAACGSTPAPTVTKTVTAPPSVPSAPATPSPAPASPAAPACLASQLSVKLAPWSSGAAGTAYQEIVLTNTSGTTCTLYGYPGVSYVTAPGGTQVGAAATRNPTYAPLLVTLGAAGGQANFTLGMVDAGVYPPVDCRQVYVDWLRIYPPGDYQSLYLQLAAQTQTCTNAGMQVLTVQTVQPGYVPGPS